MLKLVLKLLVMKFDGVKTYIGCVGMMITGLVMFLTGLGGMVGYYYPEATLPAMEPDAAWKQMGEGCVAITLGFSGLGFAHKMDKASHIKEEMGTPTQLGEKDNQKDKR